jgi:hypothetical protein
MSKITRDKRESPMPTATPQAALPYVFGMTPNMKEMAQRIGATTVPAAWPSGATGLAAAVSTCHRCGSFDVCTDWLARASNRSAASAPAFCPNAAAFERAKSGKTS